MQFTGERYIPSEIGEIRIEHYHRYALASQCVRNKVVLDMACGEGYGSALLSQVANQVVGIDISKDTIAHARQTYSHCQNLRFECRSATDTGLPNALFDVAVSFETIEHLAEQELMLAEIRRVLKPSGILLISSPNRPVYSARRNLLNVFHVKELDFSEFDALLRPHFDQIAYYGQRLAMGTIIQPLTGHLLNYQAFSDDGHNVSARTFDLSAPMYFLALCGPTDSCLPSLDASIFLPNSLDLVEHYVGFARWAKNQENEIQIRDNNVIHYKSAAEEFEKNNLELQRMIEEKIEEVKSLEQLRSKLHKEILRAEAQLDLLKDVMLSDMDGGGRI